MPSVYYAVCPGTGGTDDKKTGSPTITIASGVATLSVAQTGNIGQGFRITYDTSKVCFISKVNSSTSFDVVTATGGTPSDVGTAVAVDSITADYASLSEAEAGASDANHLNTSNLVTATTILNLVCYAGASADDTAVTVSGYTTDSSYYVNIYAPNGGTQSISSNRHVGIWDSSKYNLSPTNVNCLTISDYYVYLTGLQIAENPTATTARMGITWGSIDAVSNLTRIDCCIVKNAGAAAYALALYNTGSKRVVTAINSIFYGGTQSYGNIYMAGTVGFYNCTMHSGRYGIYSAESATTTIVNCAVFNNTNDFYGTGTMTVTYTASDDNDISGTGNIDLADSAASWNAQFADYDAANPDVSLIANSDLIGAGISHSSDSNVPEVDITGTTRSTWDIGAFEYVSDNTWNGITPAKWNGVDWGNLKWNGM